MRYVYSYDPVAPMFVFLGAGTGFEKYSWHLDLFYSGFTLADGDSLFLYTRKGFSHEDTIIVSNLIADAQREGDLPAKLCLDQNYPNPFNPSTTISYALPERTKVTISVFNTLGQNVADLVNGEQDAGYHRVQFSGSRLASGVYFCRFQAGTHGETRKLILLK
jgi:hypothetical protein